jgi:hypothetical protein
MSIRLQRLTSRNVPFTRCTEFYPEPIRERLDTMKKRRGGFTVPGPNYTWSIDGYCKLQRYGFEIYASIDAYSRFITWMYVGISAKTERSTFAQYLKVVGQHGCLPMIIRADRGTETPMIATAHFWLSAGSSTNRRLKPRRNKDGVIEYFMVRGAGEKEVQVDINAMDDGLPLYGEERPLKFDDCWSHGKSTSNQRIESWWSQLNQSRSLFWRVSF